MELLFNTCSGEDTTLNYRVQSQFNASIQCFTILDGVNLSAWTGFRGVGVGIVEWVRKIMRVIMDRGRWWRMDGKKNKIQFTPFEKLSFKKTKP